MEILVLLKLCLVTLAFIGRERTTMRRFVKIPIKDDERHDR